MTDPQPLYSDGIMIDVRELAGRQLRVTESGDRARLSDPLNREAWLEIDKEAVMEVGKR